jgi:hypothetical protein
MLLLYSMTPASAEIAQQLVHVVTEGHFANEHAAHTEDKEHGCSGPYHLCVCHSTVVFVVSVTLTDNEPIIGTETVVLGLEQAEEDGHSRSVFRPPIV